MLSTQAVLASCTDELREDLDDARAPWPQAGITHYSYVHDQTCGCDERPTRIEVEAGRVVGAEFVNSSEPVPGASLASLPTIDDLFGAVDSALEQEADSIDVTYDPARGFPTEVYIDYDRPTADEEFILRVTELTELYPGGPTGLAARPAAARAR
jgi:hypothetical protein